LEELKPSALGILEPADNPETEVLPQDIDLLVVPGLGFDPEGNRLGQGGGYFDRFLAGMRSSVPKLALAFDCQVLPSIPASPGDRRIDEVLTESTSYRKSSFKTVSRSVEETHRFASKLAARLEAPLVLRLSGELGAGKTEWVRGFALALGWGGRVRSPSFSLENVYGLSSGTLYHLDGYRLTHPSNLDLDRFEEILEDPEGLVFIEWPERFGESVPPFAPELHLERSPDGTRELTWISYETRHAFFG